MTAGPSGCPSSLASFPRTRHRRSKVLANARPSTVCLASRRRSANSLNTAATAPGSRAIWATRSAAGISTISLGSSARACSPYSGAPRLVFPNSSPGRASRTINSRPSRQTTLILTSPLRSKYTLCAVSPFRYTKAPAARCRAGRARNDCHHGARTTDSLGGQAAFQPLWCEGSGLRDELPCRVHLAPHVPQQDATHPAVLEVVDNALAERLLPVRDGLMTDVQVTDRLVAEFKKVRIEEREVVIRRGRACHVSAGVLPHLVGVVLVLDADAGAESRVGEVGDVPRRVDVRVARAEKLIHYDAGLDGQAALLRELYVGLGAAARHEDVSLKLAARRRDHHNDNCTRPQARQALAHVHLDALVAVVVHEEAG